MWLNDAWVVSKFIRKYYLHQEEEDGRQRKSIHSHDVSALGNELDMRPKQKTTVRMDEVLTSGRSE